MLSFSAISSFCLQGVQREEQKGWSLSASFSFIYLFSSLGSHVEKVEMIRSDRLSVHWKMGMSFGIGDGGWMTERKSEEGRRLRSSQDVQHINYH